MDNLRLILFFSLAFILMMIWQAWEKDYGPKPQIAATTTTQSAASNSTPSSIPTTAVPGTESSSTAVPVISSNSVVPQSASATPLSVPSVSVKTDLYTMEIGTVGGNIRKVFLNKYPASLGDKKNSFQLMKPDIPDLFVAQSGLIGGEGSSAPSHETPYQVSANSFTMADGQDELQVDLFWTSPDGVKVTKRFTYHRGTYLVTVQHMVENGSDKPWVGREYRQLMRTPPESKGATSKLIYTYTGGAIYSEENKYEKIKFDAMEESKLERSVKGGWIAMLQHYFLGAWIPPQDQQGTFYTNTLPGNRYVLGAYTPSVSVASGSGYNFTTGFVASPKLQDELKAISKGLDLSVDYGWLTVIAQPIFWLLKHIQAVVVNWGLSIILLTLLIKLAFFKLSEASYKSMANMRRMTPRIQALKDRFGEDKTRLNAAMMELYKKEKINPLGGCLPILVQIPVFISLYWVLLESVEMRQAPFIFWIEDLATKDPYFVLPLIMGITMFIQQKLNPAPPDPMQAKIMMALPFVFTVFFAFFPSGLVLYWVTNNTLSIAQQWYITRQIENATAKS
ncbi:MAG: membrane protein insertase YidC [Sedimenticola sp.]|uniref:Membrane protein insertase YidC n=1 Tax=Sedimenticola thiotaurini TaxID=1543721 RepID=A0A558DFW1_9GAMM|nr:membrane protein insertase YidC [Sedimenticola sp.]TVT59753.1 MAG: membrane protein insertase YidC [Sedimenticola thiotaurini]